MMVKVKPFVCGNFSQESDDETLSSNSGSACSTPRKSRKGHGKNNNPYSTVGLDKFSALMAELDEKRQKIYSQVDSQDILFVRFVYKSANECVPVVVKQRVKKEKKAKLRAGAVVRGGDKKDSTAAGSRLASEQRSLPEKQVQQVSEKKKKKKKARLTPIVNLNRWRRPAYYLTAVVIFILLLLVVFGRSVAVLCTSICWYAIPALVERSELRAPARKKKIVFVSDNGLPSPTPRRQNSFP